MPSFNSELAFGSLILGTMDPVCAVAGSTRPQDAVLVIYHPSVPFSVADTGAPVPGSVTAELFLLLARLPYFS